MPPLYLSLSLSLSLSLFLSLSLSLSLPSLAQEPPPPAPATGPDPMPADQVEGASADTVVPPVLVGFEEAKLPADLAVTPGVYVVTLLLTIDEQGTVTDVQVAGSEQPDLSPLAVEAARRFAFQPATYQGAPVPVQITYRYSFDIRPRERVVVFVFEAREKGSREAVDGVTGLIEENGRPFTSRDGRIEVADLPPGKYTFYVPEEDFLEVRQEFEVVEGKVGQARLHLERRYTTSRQTVIRAPKEVRFVAKQSLEAVELRRLPGSAGDPLKMVENLPGIARSPMGLGTLVVFGSLPFDTITLLHGMPVFQLYHFGGLYSTIHADFIQKIDFVPAGFDATYGRAIGGLVDVKLKEEPLTGFHGAVDVNLLHAGIIAGVPYSKDGDIQAAFRRSYIDAILQAVSFGPDIGTTTAPRYYDYQFKLQHRFAENNRLLIFINGSDDALEIVNKRARGNPKFVGTAAYSQYLHSLLATWTYEPKATVKNTLSLQAAVTGTDIDVFEQIQYYLTDVPIVLRNVTDVKLTDTLKLRAGLELIAEPAYYRVRSPQVPESGGVRTPISQAEFIETRGDYFTATESPFLSLEWQPFPWWTIVPSVRADLTQGTWDGWWIDPRLAMRFDAIPELLSFRLAGGLYQQRPVAYTYIAGFGNPDLEPEAGVHLLGGFEVTPMERLTLTMNGFYKWMFNRAEPSDDRTVRYTNDGYGRAYGLDFLLRVNPGGKFFGWIAYTWVVSEFWDFDQNRYRASDFDQQHLLNILFSYELPKHWTIGARFRLASGYPYTPYVASVYDSDADRYIGLPGRINSERMPLFHQLDIRVDKEWVFEDWKFSLYLEIQNVYNQANAEGRTYNYDYSQSGFVTGSPFLPVLGLKGEW